MVPTLEVVEVELPILLLPPDTRTITDFLNLPGSRRMSMWRLLGVYSTKR